MNYGDTMKNKKHKIRYLLLKNASKIVDWTFAESLHEAENYFAKKTYT